MSGSLSWGPSRSPIFRFATKNVNAVLKNAFEGEFKWLKSCFHGYNPILGINKLDGETFYHLRWLPPWIFKMAGLHVLGLCLRLKRKSSISIGTMAGTSLQLHRISALLICPLLAWRGSFHLCPSNRWIMWLHLHREPTALLQMAPSPRQRDGGTWVEASSYSQLVHKENFVVQKNTKRFSLIAKYY